MPGNFSADPLRTLLDNLAKNYVGGHIEQRVPLLDRDVNLLLDLAASHFRHAMARYVGDGVAANEDGFELQGGTENDFTILVGSGAQGRFLVQGLEVTIDASILYSAQTFPDGQPAPALSPPDKGQGGTRRDIVYIDAWLEDLESDPSASSIDFTNMDDVNVRTMTRQRPAWVVRVREGAVQLPQPEDTDYEEGHFYAEVAQLERPAGAAVIAAEHILDTRSTELTLSFVQKRFELIEESIARMFPNNQIARYGIYQDRFRARKRPSKKTEDGRRVRVRGGTAFIEGERYWFPRTEMLVAVQTTLDVMHRLIVAEVINGEPSIGLVDGTVNDTMPTLSSNQLLLYRIRQERDNDNFALVDHRMFGHLEADEAEFPESFEAGKQGREMLFRVGYETDYTSTVARRDSPTRFQIGFPARRALTYGLKEDSTDEYETSAYIDRWKLDSNSALPTELEEWPQVFRYVMVGAEFAPILGPATRSEQSVEITSTWFGSYICTLNHLPYGARILAVEIRTTVTDMDPNAQVRLQRRSIQGSTVENIVTVQPAPVSGTSVVRVAVPGEVTVDEDSYFTVRASRLKLSESTDTTLHHVIVEYANGYGWPSYPWKDC